MKNHIFEAIEIFMADHLNNALAESDEYKEALSAADEVYQKLMAGLTEEQQKLLDQFTALSGEAGAICEKIAYRQGMQDLIQMLFEER